MTPKCVLAERRRMRRKGFRGKPGQVLSHARDGKAHHLRVVEYTFPLGIVQQYIELWETHDRRRRARIVHLADLVHLVQNVEPCEFRTIVHRKAGRMKIVFPNPDAQPKAPPPRRSPQDVVGVVGGGSPRGSSWHRRLRMCPREHALATIVKLRPLQDNEALTVGWLFHLALEAFYRHWMAQPLAPVTQREDAAWRAIVPFAAEPGYEETYPVLERTVASYFDHYRMLDHWRVVAVEETLVAHSPTAYSARLDLIIEDLDRGGMWVCEHKTSRAITEVLLEGYQLDLQILGQVWLMQKCVDLSKYPPFRGVIVNITNKAVTPRHARVEVYPSHYHLEAFERQLSSWKRILPVYEREQWPQDFSKCSGATRGFKRCTYFDVCHAFPNQTVQQMLDLPAPYGYAKEGDEVDAQDVE